VRLMNFLASCVNNKGPVFLVSTSVLGGMFLVFGGVTGSLNSGELTATGMVIAGIFVLLVGLTCLYLVQRTQLSADYSICMSTTAFLLILYLRSLDGFYGGAALLGFASMLGLFIQRDNGDWRGILRRIRTPRA
jgi:hypothetical protein